MKPFFAVLIFMFTAFSLSAQEIDNSVFSTDRKTDTLRNTLFLSAGFFSASNAMTNELMRTYFLNGFITDQMKDDVSKNLDDKNRLGGEFSNEFYFKHRIHSLSGKAGFSWLAGIKNINHVDSKFTRDLFEVYFRGNKNYAGIKAALGPFSYTLIKYQQLQFGLEKDVKKDSISFVFSAAIGLNKGQQLLNITSAGADLYTETIGEYLDVSSSVEIHKSDSSNNHLMAFNGIGASVDLFFKASVKDKNFFYAKISNLGFIRWNDRSTAVYADTTFRFRGVDVSSLFNFADTVISQFKVDSVTVQNFLTKRKYETHTSFLPAKIELLYKHALAGKPIQIGAGADYMLHANYVPKVYFLFEYMLSRNMFALNVSYGGYTTLGAGIRYTAWLKHGYSLSVGSNYINAVFNLYKSTSQNVYMTLYRNF